MSLKNWWQNKNGKQKTITILAALLLLDMGLCFATPFGFDWISTIFHRSSTDPFEGLGLMLYQAFFCVVLVVIIGLVGIFWHPELQSRDEKKGNDD